MSAQLGPTHSAVDLLHDSQTLPAEGWVRLLEAAVHHHRLRPDPHWPTQTWFEVAVRHAASLAPRYRLEAFQALWDLGLDPNRWLQVEPIARPPEPWHAPYFFWAHTPEEWAAFQAAGANPDHPDSRGQRFVDHVRAHRQGLAGQPYGHDGQ